MIVAILMTVLAGAATAIGGLIGVWGPHTSRRILSAGVALSAGVMIYISLVELLPSAFEHAPSEPSALVAAAFGSLFVLAIERVAGNWSPADRERQSASVDSQGKPVSEAELRMARVMRTGVIMAIVLAAHNAPEGFVTLITALQDPQMAIPVAAAIAIHNIPEGIAVAVPVYHATGSRLKGWGYAAASGLAEPVGALLIHAAVGPFLNDAVYGLTNAAIAGIMVFISFHELIPLALESGKKTTAALWVIVGMSVMAVSLLVL